MSDIFQNFKIDYGPLIYYLKKKGESEMLNLNKYEFKGVLYVEISCKGIYDKFIELAKME